jgi:hypothetical protein
VPLYVNFQGKVHRDWIDIDPAKIIAGVQAGADLPSTSQPSPEDFAQAYAAAEEGATEILAITITSGMSGTFQSANLAAKDAPCRSRSSTARTPAPASPSWCARRRGCATRAPSRDEIVGDPRGMKRRT